MRPAILYLDPKCIFCRFVEPGIRRFFRRRGLDLQVFKLDGQGLVRDVRGNLLGYDSRAQRIPALPALVVGDLIITGSGILRVLRGATKGGKHGVV